MPVAELAVEIDSPLAARQGFRVRPQQCPVPAKPVEHGGLTLAIAAGAQQAERQLSVLKRAREIALSFYIREMLRWQYASFAAAPSRPNRSRARDSQG